MDHDRTDTLTCYAEALVSLGQAAGKLGEIEGQLADVQDFLSSHEETRRFMADPKVSDAGKRAALSELLDGRIHPFLWHFLQMLHEAGQFRKLNEVADKFYELASCLRESVSGELISAVQLSDERVEAMAKETGRILGRDVHLRQKVDAGLLGGAVIRVGDFVLDGTVDKQLEEMRRALLR